MILFHSCVEQSLKKKTFLSHLLMGSESSSTTLSTAHSLLDEVIESSNQQGTTRSDSKQKKKFLMTVNMYRADDVYLVLASDVLVDEIERSITFILKGNRVSKPDRHFTNVIVCQCDHDFAKHHTACTYNHIVTYRNLIPQPENTDFHFILPMNHLTTTFIEGNLARTWFNQHLR